MLSTSSSPDPAAICECGHPHANHTSASCCACEDAGRPRFDVMHRFRRQEAEAPEAPIVDVELPEGTAGCIACGGPDCICDDRCTCGHKRKKHSSTWSAGWVKEICHTCFKKDVGTWDHVFELAPEASCPHESWEVLSETPSEGGWLKTRKCADCGVPLGNVFEADSHWDIQPAPTMPRRPPYAVAYTTTGGLLYEVALPGDATVTAEDGVLKISHPSAVLALVQSRPMIQETADAADAEE